MKKQQKKREREREKKKKKRKTTRPGGITEEHHLLCLFHHGIPSLPPSFCPSVCSSLTFLLYTLRLLCPSVAHGQTAGTQQKNQRPVGQSDLSNMEIAAHFYSIENPAANKSNTLRPYLLFIFFSSFPFAVSSPMTLLCTRPCPIHALSSVLAPSLFALHNLIATRAGPSFLAVVE
jgi:hypothetical protein